MDRRQFLATAASATVAPALPAPAAPFTTGIDLAAERDVTCFFVSTPTHPGECWVWRQFVETPDQ